MTQIQEKRAYLCVGHYSVDEFLEAWNDKCSFYYQLHHPDAQPTQDDYDEWLIERACNHYIGSPDSSQIFLN